jgi:predicted XRE-type DNA-binding protein
LFEKHLKPAEQKQAEAARRVGIPLNRFNEVMRGRRCRRPSLTFRLATFLR